MAVVRREDRDSLPASDSYDLFYFSFSFLIVFAVQVHRSCELYAPTANVYSTDFHLERKNN